MAAYVKMMSSQNLPDDSPYKDYTIHVVATGGRVDFVTGEKDEAFCVIQDPVSGTSEKHQLHGNVYVLSESGKTIATRASLRPKDGVAEPTP